MRIHILSDLHIEFGDFEIPNTQSDVVVLAGDVHVGRNALKWIRDHVLEKPVVYVLGNHEFYREAMPELTDRLRRLCEDSNIHLLENNAIEIQGTTFLGCTLWTDFGLMGNAEVSKYEAEEAMIDYKLVRVSPQYRKLRANDTAKLHFHSMQWLKTQLAKQDATRTVIVTHHAPSAQSIPEIYKGKLLNAAFASNLEDLISNSNVPLWIHGHTHFCVDYNIGRTRILSNQRGYPDTPVSGFNPGLVVEV